MLSACGTVGKHGKSSAPTPQNEPDGKDPAPPPSDNAKGIDLPLTAGATVVGRLSAAEPCTETYAMTVGDMLHSAGHPTEDDAVHFGYDAGTKELAMGFKYQSKLTHEFDIFPKDADKNLVEATLRAGKSIKLTLQPQCATGTAADAVILVDYIDMAPDTFNPTWDEYDFLGLKEPTSFGATFVYDEALAWQITYTTSLTADEVRGLPDPIHYAIYNTDAMAFATAWKEASREALLTGQVKITDAQEVRRLIPNQTHLELVFDTSSQDPTLPTFYILNLGLLCKQQPTLFKNLTETPRGCAQVTDADIPKL